MSGLSFSVAPGRELRALTTRVARGVVAAPAVLVGLLFVVRPEALGSPLTKLCSMVVAGCLLMSLGELSDALVRWALPRLQARLRARSQAASPGAVLDVLTLSAAPPSTRYG